MNDETIGQWITRYADNDLLITVWEVDVQRDEPGYFPVYAIEVAPRLDPTRWDTPLPVREVPGA
jgi:hypothetical protein